MVGTRAVRVESRGVFVSRPRALPCPLHLQFQLTERLPPNRLPVEHSTSEIQAGTKDPFLYNPRTKAAQAGKVSMILCPCIMRGDLICRLSW